tara:strand:- start:202 stop:669 length:468 start_codon:yes stop_codon:yes gene_type:complete
MKTFEFDDKNKEDYETHTDLILDALDKIRKDKRLSASIASIVKLTGLHRNTISNRDWPKQKLEQIKEKRTKTKADNKIDEKSQITILEETLENACHELVHWFTLSQEKINDLEQLKANYELMIESRDFYKDAYNKEKSKVSELTKQVARLKDLYK